MFEEQLTMATRELPGEVRRWVRRALGSGWFRFGFGAYEDPGPILCPIAAAASLAGVWVDGAVMPGNPAWGDAAGPAESVEEFAAWFDLHAGDVGLAAATEIVLAALAPKTVALAA